MSMDLNQIFADIANATPTDGGQYFTDGDYLAVITDIRMKSGHKGLSFIAEHLVKESTSIPGAKDHKTGDAILARPPGAIASFVENTSNPKTRAMALGNIKSYLCGILGKDPNAVTAAEVDATLKALCGSDGVKTQPLRGKLVRVKAWSQEKQTKAGEFYTKKKFTAVTQTPDEIAAERAALDAGK